jgi:hypothetical protein
MILNDEKTLNVTGGVLYCLRNFNAFDRDEIAKKLRKRVDTIDYELFRLREENVCYFDKKISKWRIFNKLRKYTLEELYEGLSLYPDMFDKSRDKDWENICLSVRRVKTSKSFTKTT